MSSVAVTEECHPETSHGWLPRPVLSTTLHNAYALLTLVSSALATEESEAAHTNAAKTMVDFMVRPRSQ